MVRGRGSSIFASLLLALQLVAAPFANAEAFPASDAGCHGMSHAQAPTAVGADAGQHAKMSTDMDCHRQSQGHHCRTHAACSCQCAHTPALAVILPFIVGATPPSAVHSTLAGPAFDQPLFDFLRPPK